MINGSYRIFKDGELVAENSNIITNFGKDSIMKYLTGSIPDWCGAIAIGAGIVTPTATDLRLGFEFSRATTKLRSAQTNISASIINKVLTSNIATLTTAYSHDFRNGDSIVISGIDATFNGTYTITGTPLATTFTYAKTATDVASTALTTYGAAMLSVSSTSARRIVVKTSLDPSVVGTIYEAGVFTELGNTTSGGFDSKLLSSTDEGIDAVGNDTSKWYGGTIDTTNQRIGSSSFTINNTHATLGANTAYTTLPGTLNFDMTGYAGNDLVQIAYYITNVTSITGKTLTIKFYDMQTAPKTMSYSISLTGKSVGFYVDSIPLSSFSVDSGFNNIVGAIDIATTHTQNISIDGIRLDDIDATNINYGMVSRALFSTPIVKTLGETLDIEYSLSLAMG
jgi:hypothetical protein